MPLLHTGQFFGQGSGGGGPPAATQRQAMLPATGTAVFVNTSNTTRQSMAAGVQVNET